MIHTNLEEIVKLQHCRQLQHSGKFPNIYCLHQTEVESTKFLQVE